MNCAFAGGDMTYLFNNLCGTFMPALYTLAWLCGVVGVMGLFVVLSLYCLAIKMMRQRNGLGGNPSDQAKNQEAISPETGGMVQPGNFSGFAAQS